MLWRVDPRTNKVATRIPAEGYPDAFGGGSLWLPSRRRVTRIDIETREATYVSVGNAGSITVSHNGDVWLAASPESGGNVVWRISPKTNEVAGKTTLDTMEISDIAAGADGSVSVVLFDQEKVVRLAPRE